MHTYIYIYTHTHTHTHTHIYPFADSFSIIGYYKILNIY